VFGAGIDQSILYKEAGLDKAVKAVFLGRHTSVFAYGVSSGGKTFTMTVSWNYYHYYHYYKYSYYHHHHNNNNNDYSSNKRV